MANETYNILQGIFNGQTPIQCTNPMKGQSEYYYMKPNQNSYTPLSQMQKVDVPSATTPNPYLTKGNSNSYYKNTLGDYFAENITDKTMTDKRVENIMNIVRYGLPDEAKQIAIQSTGAVYDLIKNYINMRIDNTIGADDCFHCKSQYDATSRGKYGEEIAKALGNEKEIYDYYENQILNEYSQEEANKDYNHDQFVNQTGRQQARSGLYLNSKDGCDIFRVKGINERF